MASFDTKPVKRNVQSKKDTGPKLPSHKAADKHAQLQARKEGKGKQGGESDRSNGNQPYDIVTEGPNGQVGLSSVEEAIAQKKGLFLKRKDGEVFFRRASSVQLFRNHPTVVPSKNQLSRQIAALRRSEAAQQNADASNEAMTIAPENSPQEAEADRVADKVVSRKKTAESVGGAQPSWGMQMKRLMRNVAIQRKKDKEAGVIPKRVQSGIESKKGGGNKLPEVTRSEMEEGIGADLSNVRIHDDSASHQMNEDVNAQAFTHGKDVFFGAGKYQPGTDAGDHLLAHELTHTVQQGESPVKKKAKGNISRKKGDKVTDHPFTALNWGKLNEEASFRIVQGLMLGWRSNDAVVTGSGGASEEVDAGDGKTRSEFTETDIAQGGNLGYYLLVYVINSDATPEGEKTRLRNLLGEENATITIDETFFKTIYGAMVEQQLTGKVVGKSNARLQLALDWYDLASTHDFSNILSIHYDETTTGDGQVDFEMGDLRVVKVGASAFNTNPGDLKTALDNLLAKASTSTLPADVFNPGMEGTLSNKDKKKGVSEKEKKYSTFVGTKDNFKNKAEREKFTAGLAGNDSINNQRLNSPKSVAVVHHLLGIANPGVFNEDSSYAIAYYKSQNGLGKSLKSTGGEIDQATIAHMVEKIVEANPNAAIQLVLDYNNLYEEYAKINGDGERVEGANAGDGTKPGELIGAHHHADIGPHLGAGSSSKAAAYAGGTTIQGFPSYIEMSDKAMKGATDYATILSTLSHELVHVKQNTQGFGASDALLAHYGPKWKEESERIAGLKGEEKETANNKLKDEREAVWSMIGNLSEFSANTMELTGKFGDLDLAKKKFEGYWGDFEYIFDEGMELSNTIWTLYQGLDPEVDVEEVAVLAATRDALNTGFSRAYTAASSRTTSYTISGFVRLLKRQFNTEHNTLNNGSSEPLVISANKSPAMQNALAYFNNDFNARNQRHRTRGGTEYVDRGYLFKMSLALEIHKKAQEAGIAVDANVFSSQPVLDFINLKSDNNSGIQANWGALKRAFIEAVTSKTYIQPSSHFTDIQGI